MGSLDQPIQDGYWAGINLLLLNPTPIKMPKGFRVQACGQNIRRIHFHTILQRMSVKPASLCIRDIKISVISIKRGQNGQSDTDTGQILEIPYILALLQKCSGDFT